MGEVVKYTLFYFVINIVTIFMCTFYLGIKNGIFKRDYLKRLEKDPTTIPSVIYYTGRLVKYLFIIVFGILLFPTTVFVLWYQHEKALRASKCFERYDSRRFDVMQKSVILTVGSDRIKKKRIKCEYFTAYNNKLTPDDPYFCHHFCPVFHGETKYLLFTDDDELKYEKEHINFDLIDIDTYSL